MDDLATVTASLPVRSSRGPWFLAATDDGGYDGYDTGALKDR